ncbi:MAG: META domain-containing protein [Steroidobacter sp.]
MKYGYPTVPRRVVAITWIIAAAACTSQKPQSAEPEGGVTFELAGTRWALMRLGDRDVKISDGGREAYIHLNSADSSVVGYAGCNRISSTHRTSGSQLSFGEVIATRMFCDDMPTETALLEVMKSTTSWRITGSRLELLDARQRSLAAFEARNL